MNKEKLYEFTNMFLAEQRYKKFLYKAKNKYGDRYDYSKVDYINANIDIIIKCNKHNIEFANYKKLPPEAKMRDYDSYLFNPI